MKSLGDPVCMNETLARLGRIRSDSSRKWGRMNAHQMICHLTDSFNVAMGRTYASPAEKRIGPVTKWLALNMPFHWPKGVPTRPEIDQEKGGTAPAEFAADLRALSSLIADFTSHPRNFTFAAHPFFGNMTEAEWLRWGYLHTDHHLRQFGC